MQNHLKYYFTIIAICCCFFAQAQVKKVATTTAKLPATTTRTTTLAKTTTDSTKAKTATTTTVIDKPPVFRSMADYRKSPQAAKRKADLAKKKPAYKPLTKHISYQSGPGMTVTVDKNPPKDPTTGVKEKKVTPEKKESSGGYDCTTQQVNLSATSATFMNNDYSPSVINIYPGACYTYANLTDGNWQPQKGDRYPLTITCNNPNIKGNSYVTIPDPNIATIETGLGKLFRGFENVNAAESQSSQVTESENSATYNLEIGAGVSGYGADISNTYQTGNQSTTVYLTFDAIKTLFTFSAVPPDSGFFKDPNVEATPYLSFISDVSYGCRVLGNATLTFNSSQEADNFKASYSGFGVSAFLGVDYGSTSKNYTAVINAYVVGGPGNLAPAANLQELQKEVNDAFTHTNYQNARPVSYVACDMDGDVLNTTSATDQFTVKNCVPASAGSAEIENIAVTFTQGPDGKEPKTNFMVGIFPGQNANTNNVNAAAFWYTSCNGQDNCSSPRFNNNGTATVILEPGYKGTPDQYKGKRDLEAFTKAGGGTIVVYGISNTNGYDVWQISNIAVKIQLKTTSANPTGAGAPKTFNVNLSGPNMLNLDTRSPTNTVYQFDQNFNIVGQGSSSGSN